MLPQVPRSSQVHDPWVVEWCCSGGQRGLFHIQNLSGAIKSNRKFFSGRAADPWLIIGVFDNAEGAYTFSDTLIERRDAGRQDEVQP